MLSQMLSLLTHPPTLSQENLFEWHFTLRGPPGTDYANGVYHGRILLPSEYPFKPPNIMLLTVCPPSPTHPPTYLRHRSIHLLIHSPTHSPTYPIQQPNGRFEVGKKICLSISAHHPEHWQPAWGGTS